MSSFTQNKGLIMKEDECVLMLYSFLFTAVIILKVPLYGKLCSRIQKPLH
jgi:hypothetical protein